MKQTNKKIKRTSQKRDDCNSLNMEPIISWQGELWLAFASFSEALEIADACPLAHVSRRLHALSSRKQSSSQKKTAGWEIQSITTGALINKKSGGA